MSLAGKIGKGKRRSTKPQLKKGAKERPKKRKIGQKQTRLVEEKEEEENDKFDSLVSRNTLRPFEESGKRQWPREKREEPEKGGKD